MAEKKTVQEAIKEIILKLRGKDIFKNMKQFWALLDDLAPEFPKERKIVKRSLDEDLLAVFVDDSKTVRQRIKILLDNFDDLGVKEDCADFIIEAFGMPLGWNKEIREMKLDRQSSSVTAQTPADENANYEDIILDEEGLRKLGITDKKSLTTLNIPATFNTFIGTVYRITKIDDNIFKDCDKLETVTIPDTVTEIGIGTFEGCKSLKSINIPNEVTKIENNVFRGCSALTKMIIPNKVAEIGNYAFADCELLENLLLPDSVIKIGDYAFKNCINAFKDNVIIPNYAISLSFTAFDGCEKIEQFTVPVGISAFKVFKEVTLDENVLKQLGYDVEYKEKGTSKQELVSFKKNGQDVTSFYIPATYTYEGKIYKITKISNRAFRSCSSLISVIMPDNSVTNIGDSAFSWCKSLTSVTIPNRVTNIGECAFYNCESLKNVIIPNSVTNIGDSAFSGCKSLTSVTIPNSVKNIDNAAFAYCSSLSISIPNNCSYNGYVGSSRNNNSNYSFYKCKDVTQRS